MSWSKKEIPTSQFCNVFNRGVVKKTAQNSTKFSQYLCFNIIIGSNDLCAEQKYTKQQQRNHDLIKSLHDGGMGYRKIADYLNEQGIKTARGNTWKNTQVFSVLKKYRQRLDRIKNVRQFNHDVEISKFELKWIKDND
jgi:hypothetical protein